MAKTQLSLFLLAAMGCALMGPTSAMDHIVGGSFGWSIPKNLTFYQEWAKPRTFGIGDKLVFLYRTGVHNVLQVNEKEFNACTQDKVIQMLYKGPTIVELTKLGNYYYYCGVGMHCEAGQKLSITVTNAVGSSGLPFETPANAPAASANTTTTTTSSANSVYNFGLVSCLVYFLVSLFI